MSPFEWTGDIVGIFFVLGSNDSGQLNSAHVGNTYGVVRLSNFSLEISY